ncbi:MAG TPA: SCO family protein [Kofleriaceae bacterium]
MSAISLLVACSGGVPTDRPAAPEPVPVPVEENVASEPEPSIYDLPIELRDANGHVIGLDVARGKPVLVTMFYASCPVACPVLLQEVKQVVAELPAELEDDVGIVMVSFDPDRDTPAKLRELVAARGLDDRYTVAAASVSDARALAATLGVTYRKLDNGEFFHGATIVALDREGHPVARTDQLGQRGVLAASLR